jgi:hypothetical protein
MTIAGFDPIYRSTVVPRSAPASNTPAPGWRAVLERYAVYRHAAARTAEGTAASGPGAVPMDASSARDRADASRLFDAVSRGDIDGYHAACRDASRAGAAPVEAARDAAALKRLLDDAHRLVGHTDGNLLNHAAKARPGHGKEACIALMVRDGIVCGMRDAQGFTAAMRLVGHRRDLASLAKLVPNMSVFDIDRTNAKDGHKSALHYAIKAGNLPAVKLLIEAGANVNLACANRSPVAMARKAGHAEMVRCLYRAGGVDGPSVAGARDRPSWSLTSLTPNGRESVRATPSSRAPVRVEAEATAAADPFGDWPKDDSDFLQRLTPETKRHLGHAERR